MSSKPLISFREHLMADTHACAKDSLYKHKHSKDNPSLAQVKPMIAALYQLNLTLVTQV